MIKKILLIIVGLILFSFVGLGYSNPILLYIVIVSLVVFSVFNSLMIVDITKIDVNRKMEKAIKKAKLYKERGYSNEEIKEALMDKFNDDSLVDSIINKMEE